MTPAQIKAARALVERLDALATKATPMDIGTAEIVQDEGYFECAMCNGSGETWGNGYLNIDGIALNVQFSGIGSEFKDNERFVMALIEAYRSGTLTAALDEIERLETRIRSLDHALNFILSDAAWTPNHPACESIINRINALRKGADQ